MGDAKTTVEQFVYDLYNSAKKRSLLLGDRRLMVSWKLLKYDFDMSQATFKRYLQRAIDAGYLIRARRGIYVMTEKGFFLVQGYEFAITIAGYGTKSLSGGISPQAAQAPPFKKLPSSSAKDLFLGIRLHNVKVQFKVMNWPSGMLTRDIRSDPYFTIQIFKDQNKILVHLKQDFKGISPSEVMMKLMKYILMTIERLYKEYGINVELGGWDIKHWEWAYQFNLRKIPNFEGLKNTLAVLGEHMRSYIDYSKGLLEIETNDDMWAMFFFLQPFLSVMTFDQVLQFQTYMQAFETQIAKHLKTLDMIQDGFERFNMLLDRFMKVVGDEGKD